MPGLPFAVLVENSGLVAWRGHPDDRDLEADINTLMKDHMLFETEDWYDDPDKPKPDHDEVEMSKDLDTVKKKPKPLDRIMKEIEDKILFFNDKLTDINLNVKAEEAGMDNKKTVFETFKQKAEKLTRAYIVFESTVTADLEDESKYTHTLIVHAVCQGEASALKDTENYLHDVLKAIYGSWRKHVTDNDAKEKETKKKADSDATTQIKTESKPTTTTQSKTGSEPSAVVDDEEESLYEKTKLNWLWRELYIDEAGDYTLPKEEKKEEEKKEESKN